MPRQGSLTERRKREFARDGYLLIRDRAIGRMKARLRRQLRELALRILAKSPLPGLDERLLRCDFASIFNACLSLEKENRVSRAFYELFPASSALISLVSHPLFDSLSRALGVATPIPSTLPILRIDRPLEDRFLTPIHQDYWYSMLCLNSITFWMPVLPVTKDMGLLEAIPGSHRLGPLPIKAWTAENPFTARRRFDDADFVPLEVGDDELLVFSQLLVHRSAVNRGKRARLTLQVRYNDLETMTVPTSSFTPQYSPFVVAAQRQALSADGSGGRHG